MPKKKYYAVRIGRTPGIYGTWDECKKQTDGFSGAIYQSFSFLAQAEQYLLSTISQRSDTLGDVDNQSTDLNTQIDSAIANLNEGELIAFVDGSYDTKGEKSAFGAIIFGAGGTKDILYKAFTKQLGEEFISLRNVAAELEGVKEAINWAIQYHKTKITIYYDYEGIEKWATGEWKASKRITQDYVRFISEKKRALEINFIKVPAHSGVMLNEEVDKLAKGALLAKGHKTYNDGSVYFIGYGVKDWETIIQCINEENNQLPETIDPISFTTEQIGTRTRIKVQHGKNVVVINCYNNTKSYVQGKQNSLFQKIVASAIEVLTNSQSVVETLNSYHALTLTKTEVETKFEELLPYYRHFSSKHYTNLLSAVYNTMLTGYMPDYTCLVTPLFRAFEYYLHRILGDIMQLDTEDSKGKNVFSYFSKNATGQFECNNPQKAVLSASQLDYLNKLYTNYNKIRHPYSHWSASDIDTAVITSIQEARQLLLDGLSLINQYYVIF